MIDIRRKPDVVEAINLILSDHGIAEVKYDSALKQIAVIRIDRRIVHPPKENRIK